MVWYPTVDDIIDANKVALLKGRDKHPHKLLGARRGIQGLINGIIDNEGFGLTYQVALLMQRILIRPLFDGGNHRTAYYIAELFLTQNGVAVRTVAPEIAYDHIRHVPEMTIPQIQQWIITNMS